MFLSLLMAMTLMFYLDIFSPTSSNSIHRLFPYITDGFDEMIWDISGFLITFLK